VAHAYATGIEQEFSDASANILAINSGAISAQAFALAFGSHGKYTAADAAAWGIRELHNGTLEAPVVINNGLINVAATAIDVHGRGVYTALGPHGFTDSATGAHADAFGIVAVNQNHAGGGKGIVAGDLINEAHGDIHVDAIGGGPFANAEAVGIGVEAYAFGGVIANSGTIDAQAFGAHATAVGIGVTNVKTDEGHHFGAVAATRLVGEIVNEGGFIFASTGKATVTAAGFNAEPLGPGHIGEAIEVENAPNLVNIYLEGGAAGQAGEIYGNIEDAEAPANWVNNIVVEDGKTFLDGNVNGELTPLTLGNGGTLSISANGTLWLSDKRTSFWKINPQVNVASFSQAGTLEIDVDAFGDNATINAVNASLGGALVLDQGAYSLFGNATVFTIVKGTITGTWASVALTSVSPLLTVSDTVGASSATATITRVAFNAAALDLTHNEEAVATGLENAYLNVQANQTNPAFAQAVLFYESIFRFSGAQYPLALNMLSDAQAGEVAQANVVAVNGFDDRVDDRLASMAAILAAGGSVGMGQGGFTLWGEPYGTWTNTGSTISGPGYSTSNGGATLGADVQLDGEHAILGLAGDISAKSQWAFKNGQWASLTGGTGTTATGSVGGWDIGLYGRFDADSFYLQGKGSYGTYNDTATRWLTMPLFGNQEPLGVAPSPPKADLYPNVPLAPSASGRLTDSFNSDVWSVDGEVGVPVAVEPGFDFTPYAAIRYINSQSGNYNEGGSVNGRTSANLHVNGADGEELSTYLGAEFATLWDVGGSQALEPSLRVAWQHNFEDPWKVNAYFLGVGPTSTFQIDASAWSRDSGLVDFGLSMVFQNNMTGTLGYNANINSTQFNQTVYGRLDIKF